MAPKDVKKDLRNHKDKLAEALRRAEEAVLRTEVDDPEARKNKREFTTEKKKTLDPPDLLEEVIKISPSPTKTIAKTREPQPAPAAKPIEKERPAVQVHSAPASPVAPDETASKAKTSTQQKASVSPLSFGEVELSGGPDTGTNLELDPSFAPHPAAATEIAPEQPRAARTTPVPQPAPEPQQLAPVPEHPVAPVPPRAHAIGAEKGRLGPLLHRPETPRTPVTLTPQRSYKREVKIVLIVLLVLAAIGSGVIGIIKWQESVQAHKQAEQDRVNQSRLDYLKDDTFKRETLK